jgi:hypothetical protein
MFMFSGDSFYLLICVNTSAKEYSLPRRSR